MNVSLRQAESVKGHEFIIIFKGENFRKVWPKRETKVKNNASGYAGDARRKRHGIDAWAWRIPWRKKCLSTPVFLPGKSHGQRSWEGYSP